MTGLFITFEGGEGSGKTTLIQKCREFFVSKGKEVVLTREPGGTVLGEEIRHLLLHYTQNPLSSHTELSLFLASRSQHVLEKILPSLQEGKVVLCDRFNDSSVAYQGYARGLGMEKVQEICLFFSLNLTPHLTFYLDLDPKEGLKRVSSRHKETPLSDRIESEELSFHEKVRKGYLLLAQKEPGRIKVLDARQPPEAVFSEAATLLKNTLLLT